ncbi:MAG: Na+/H+ antiporter NhaA [Phycisphaerae bacterium]
MDRAHHSWNYDLLGGVTLFTGAALSMVAANSPLLPMYNELVNTHFVVKFGELGLSKPLQLWINDGLMAVFFLFVGLELKRELLVGNLSSLRSASLPLAAALGGVVVPALIFVLLNPPETRRGWAIPTATDIAFALGVVSMLSRRVPPALKAFILSLAVFDDLAAIIIIATFYTSGISYGAQFAAVAVMAILLLLNRTRVMRLGPYLLLGVILWACVLKSGVHATLSGVLVALSIPMTAEDGTKPGPLEALEHALRPWVVFLILPLFAFANSGISLHGITPNMMMEPVTLGIIAGLFVGKVLGVCLGTACLVVPGFATLPGGVGVPMFIGAGFLTGIGYTMSLFIGTLAFEAEWHSLGREMKLGVLAGSFLSVVLGVVIVLLTSRHDANAPVSPPAMPKQPVSS